MEWERFMLEEGRFMLRGEFMLEGVGSCWRVEFILEGERIMLEGGGSHLETINVCRWP